MPTQRLAPPTSSTARCSPLDDRRRCLERWVDKLDHDVSIVRDRDLVEDFQLSEGDRLGVEDADFLDQDVCSGRWGVL